MEKIQDWCTHRKNNVYIIENWIQEFYSGGNSYSDIKVNNVNSDITGVLKGGKLSTLFSDLT